MSEEKKCSEKSLVAINWWNKLSRKARIAYWHYSEVDNHLDFSTINARTETIEAIYDAITTLNR